MNLAELHRKLIAAARADTPSDRVPYSFEKRIMARLREVPIADAWGVWGAALWRAAVPCLVVMMLLSAWTVLLPSSQSSANSAATSDLSSELENTLLAAVDAEASTESVW